MPLFLLRMLVMMLLMLLMMLPTLLPMPMGMLGMRGMGMRGMGSRIGGKGEGWEKRSARGGRNGKSFGLWEQRSPSPLLLRLHHAMKAVLHQSIMRMGGVGMEGMGMGMEGMGMGRMGIGGRDGKRWDRTFRSQMNLLFSPSPDATWKPMLAQRWRKRCLPAKERWSRCWRSTRESCSSSCLSRASTARGPFLPGGSRTFPTKPSGKNGLGSLPSKQGLRSSHRSSI